MRSAAPPVRYLSPDAGASWCRFQRALAALAASACGAWLAGWSGVDSAWLVGLVVFASAVSGAVAIGRWLDPAAVDLAWDGAIWACDGVAGAVVVRIDLGTHLLVRFDPATAGPARWLVLTRRGAPQAWHALRVALRAAPPTRAGLPAASLAP